MPYREVVMPTWKEKLAGKMDSQLEEEIDVFETQIALRRSGKLDEKIFRCLPFTKQFGGDVVIGLRK